MIDDCLHRFILLASLALGGQLGLGAAVAGGTLAFEPVAVPRSDDEKSRINASPRVTVQASGESRTYPIGYRTLLRSGDAPPQGGIFGALTDVRGQILNGGDGLPVISNANDFSSLLDLGSNGLFMVSHFETLPGAAYLTELRQDHQGHLEALRTRPLNLAPLRGIWLPCAGSVTPWNTHLGSEEYEPDARLLQPDGTMPQSVAYGAMAAYFADEGVDAMNPYDYGWPIEIAVRGFTEADAVKHYAMGRMALELAYVMPDRRTVYLSDDGTGVALFMFVAERDGDLSSGTLYAARWLQKSADNGGEAGLVWHNLGYARSGAIRALLAQRPRFDQIFDTTEPLQGECPASYTSINHGHSTRQPYAGQECLRLRQGDLGGVPMRVAASRLEARRFAALEGATTEFNKVEGITFDPESKTIYVAMTSISRGMEDSAQYGKPTPKYDGGGPNHVRLPFNRCGTVFALSLEGGVSDAATAAIDSDYVAVKARAAVSGTMTRAWGGASAIPPYPADGPFAENRCDLEGIANPDNLTFIPGYDTLLIAEDSGRGHENNAIWAYNTRNQRLDRILTAPAGAENTSLYFYPDLRGRSYIMAVIQHPFQSAGSRRYRPAPGAERAHTGYIGPLPALPGG